jgi:hypothetical protein
MNHSLRNVDYSTVSISQSKGHVKRGFQGACSDFGANPPAGFDREQAAIFSSNLPRGGLSPVQGTIGRSGRVRRPKMNAPQNSHCLAQPLVLGYDQSNWVVAM